MNTVKILLVADDEDDYFLTQKLLAYGIDTCKYKLSWCSSYSDSINAMLKDRYDLYLVNYKFRDRSGIHLLSEAVKSNCTKPIIILTGKDDKDIDEEALKAGAADYLPIDQISSETLERSIRYVTKQFEILEKLKRNEHTFRVLFERSKDAIVISNPSGQILDANSSALRFFGLDHSEMANINCAFFYQHPRERQALVKILQRDGVINEMLIELLTLKGDSRTCCVTSFIEIPQHGETELFYTFVRDISDSRHQFLSSEMLPQAYDLRTQLPQSVKAVRTSLSKINEAIETKLNLETYSQNASLFDTIRMNASFADQALQTLEEEHERYKR
ncbi:PAS domain S-box protein [Arcticibacter sp.]|uniref:PAS domain S-box protein n=1 Tax=Arcticibacter sp. TaxID=1872630 RepID=UPI00388D6D8B